MTKSEKVNVNNFILLDAISFIVFTRIVLDFVGVYSCLQRITGCSDDL